MNTYPSRKPTQNRKIAFILIGVVLGMFAFGYALVPFYNVLCLALGIGGGKTSNKAADLDLNSPVDTSRTITVQFLATRNDNLPWEFKPKDTVITMHPGETKATAYFAHNLSNKPMVVQAIPSVVPGEAAKYIRKTECFCFSQQYFAAGEAMDMPLLFRIDRSLPAHIRTITLSYTLFNAEKYINNPPKKEVGRIN